MRNMIKCVWIKHVNSSIHQITMVWFFLNPLKQDAIHFHDAERNLGRVFMALLFSAGVTALYGILTFLLQDQPQLGTRIRGFHGFYLTNSGILLLCTFVAGLFGGWVLFSIPLFVLLARRRGGLSGEGSR